MRLQPIRLTELCISSAKVWCSKACMFLSGNGAVVLFHCEHRRVSDGTIILNPCKFPKKLVVSQIPGDEMTSRNHRGQNAVASSIRENESPTMDQESCTDVSDSEENKTLLEKKAKDLCYNIPKDLNDKGLARFLRAFRSVDQAFNAIIQYLKWRKEFGVDSITIEDSDVKNELRSGKAILLEDRDNFGRPILLVTAKLHNSKDRNRQGLMKFIVYLLESAGHLCDDDACDNFCIIFDMKDFSMSSMDYQFIKSLIWLLSNYYPERLGIWLIVNPPVLFTGCWAIIRGWLDEKTAKKVVFVSRSEQLAEYIRLDSLPRNLFQ